jgi:Ribonuclease G/E
MKPPQGGLIVRTLAEGLTKKQLKADVGYLVRLWGEVVKKREMGEAAPTCLYSELDLVLKTARDLFTDDIEKIVIDDADEYARLRASWRCSCPTASTTSSCTKGKSRSSTRTASRTRSGARSRARCRCRRAAT